ncbi:YwdI family protein [Bacillus songklensis]|uniref:YwdI family protein n=1 Tax=Bacillus songklensis TaxID=1069116 RepID=A0ABV8BB62_9BACI
MNISMLQLLEKMNEEMHQAIQEVSSQKERHLRDRLVAIKTLCELAMDQQTEKAAFSAVSLAENKPVLAPSQTLSKPMEISDGANGESLFDF